MPIAHIANLWSLVAHPAPEREWKLEKKIRAVADAGFDGFTTALGREHRALDSQSPIWQRVGMEIPASSFKLRANASEDRKAISYQLLSAYLQHAREYTAGRWIFKPNLNL